MDYPGTADPHQATRWPTATQGVQVVVAALLLQVLLSLVAGGLYAVLTSSGRAGSAGPLVDLVSWVVQLGAPALLLAQIVGLQLVMKDVQAAQGMGRTAQVLLGVDLALGAIIALAYRVANAFVLAQYAGYLGFAASAAAGGLVLEALLRVRRAASAPDREPTEALVRGGYWTLVGLRALQWAALPFLMRGFAELPRLGLFGARAVLNLLMAGLVVLLARSVLGALRAAPAEGLASGGPGPLLDATLDAALSQALRARALRTILIGAAWAVVGIGVTFWSLTATRGMSGRFVIAWGAIAFGLVQIGRGLFQLSKR